MDIEPYISVTSDDENELEIDETEKVDDEDDDLKKVDPKEMVARIDRGKRRGNKIIYAYRCLKCQKIFANKIIALDHFYATHLNIKRYPCDQCESKFVNQSSLLLHQKNKHQRQSIPRQKRKKIEKIKKSISPISEFKKSREESEIQIKEGDFVAPPVPDQSEKIKRKPAKRDSNGLFTCEVCNQKFKWSSNYSTHKMRCHPEYCANFTCTLCNKGFKWEGSYQSHLKKFHLGLPVVCKLCGDVFKNSTEEEEHREEVDLTCTICNEIFQSKCMLTQHTVDIFESKKCCKCVDEKFGNLFLLWKHKRIVHEEKTIQCCHNNYMRIKTYQNHLKVVHYNITD